METSIIRELIGVLEQEEAVYKDINRISKDKTQIIINGKVSELESIIKVEQALIFEVGRIEDQREKIVEKIARQLGKKEEELTLSFLSDNINEVEGKRLKELHSNMTNIVQELNYSNQLNTKLIKSSLEYINFSLNLFASSDNTDNSYCNTGEKTDEKGKKKSFFDFKV